MSWRSIIGGVLPFFRSGENDVNPIRPGQGGGAAFDPIGGVVPHWLYTWDRRFEDDTAPTSSDAGTHFHSAVTHIQFTYTAGHPWCNKGYGDAMSLALTQLMKSEVAVMLNNAAANIDNKQNALIWDETQGRFVLANNAAGGGGQASSRSSGSEKPDAGVILPLIASIVAKFFDNSSMGSKMRSVTDMICQLSDAEAEAAISNATTRGGQGGDGKGQTGLQGGALVSSSQTSGLWEDSVYFCFVEDIVAATLICGESEQSIVCPSSLEEYAHTKEDFPNQDCLVDSRTLHRGSIPNKINFSDRELVLPLLMVDMIKSSQEKQLPRFVPTQISLQESLTYMLLYRSNIIAASFSRQPYLCGADRVNAPSLVPGWRLPFVITIMPEGDPIFAKTSAPPDLKNDAVPLVFVSQSEVSPCSFLITVRGTATMFEWIQDFEYWQTPFFVNPKARTHVGFSRILSFVLPSLELFLTEASEKHSCTCRNTHLFFTGHSLGAGVAQLLALHFASKYKRLPFPNGSQWNSQRPATQTGGRNQNQNQNQSFANTSTIPAAGTGGYRPTAEGPQSYSQKNNRQTPPVANPNPPNNFSGRGRTTSQSRAQKYGAAVTYPPESNSGDQQRQPQAQPQIPQHPQLQSQIPRSPEIIGGPLSQYSNSLDLDGELASDRASSLGRAPSLSRDYFERNRESGGSPPSSADSWSNGVPRGGGRQLLFDDSPLMIASGFASDYPAGGGFRNAAAGQPAARSDYYDDHLSDGARAVVGERPNNFNPSSNNAPYVLPTPTGDYSGGTGPQRRPPAPPPRSQPDYGGNSNGKWAAAPGASELLDGGSGGGGASGGSGGGASTNAGLDEEEQDGACGGLDISAVVFAPPRVFNQYGAALWRRVINGRVILDSGDGLAYMPCYEGNSHNGWARCSAGHMPHPGRGRDHYADNFGIVEISVGYLEKRNGKTVDAVLSSIFPSGTGNDEPSVLSMLLSRLVELGVPGLGRVPSLGAMGASHVCSAACKFSQSACGADFKWWCDKCPMLLG